MPIKSELEPLLEHLKWARDATLETVRWVAAFSFPDFEQDYEFVALHHPDEYPFNEGRLVSNKGLDIDISDFDYHFIEEHVKHSTALHSILKKRGAYYVGPLARLNLNFDKLTPLAQEAAHLAGIEPYCYNPFKSIIARSVETLYSCDEALRLIEEYEMPDKPALAVHPCKTTGYGCTEAPRGALYHRYGVDDQGMIIDAQIVPPTSQNQKTIERDLRQFISQNLHLPDEQLTWQCEQVIRKYDPCISCSAHFLKLKLEQELQ